MNYASIYKKAALQDGWSKKNTREGEVAWENFYDFGAKKLSGNEVVLDIGTAEGNNFLRIARHIKKGIGIDREPKMIQLAKRNAKERGLKNITFRIMDARKINFSSSFFDAVFVKHSPLWFKEVYRVLKPGAWCITQQVHETDKMNLKETFGRGRNYGVRAGTLLQRFEPLRAKARSGSKKETKLLRVFVLIPHVFF